MRGVRLRARGLFAPAVCSSSPFNVKQTFRPSAINQIGCGGGDGQSARVPHRIYLYTSHKTTVCVCLPNLLKISINKRAAVRGLREVRVRIRIARTHIVNCCVLTAVAAFQPSVAHPQVAARRTRRRPAVYVAYLRSGRSHACEQPPAPHNPPALRRRVRVVIQTNNRAGRECWAVLI